MLFLPSVFQFGVPCGLDVHLLAVGRIIVLYRIILRLGKIHSLKEKLCSNVAKIAKRNKRGKKHNTMHFCHNSAWMYE